MRAVQLTETGGPDVLRIGDVPDPVAGPGEVVVTLKASALNRRDVFLRKGIAPSPLPVILGSDGAGVVTQVAEQVKSVGSTVGQRRAFSWLRRGRGGGGGRLPDSGGSGRRHRRRDDPYPGRERLREAGATVVAGGGRVAAGRTHRMAGTAFACPSGGR